MPKVELFAFTPEAELVVATAARRCYSADSTEQILTHLKGDPTRVRELIRLVWKRQHLGVFEHVTYSFAISDVSRAMTHQLVRHRIASYAQESQRYVDYSKGQIPSIVPPSIQKHPELIRALEDHYKNGVTLYNMLVSKGIPGEDARYALAEGTGSKIIITQNARQLFHFFEMRCCQKAQWEIREIADKMLCIARTASPILFEEAGPVCKRRINPYCRESSPHCPNFPKK